MAGSGNIIADFGPFPGQSDVVVAVTGQAGIVATSEVEAWVEPAATAAGFQSDGYPFDGVRWFDHGGPLTGNDSTLGIVSLWVYDANPPQDAHQPGFSYIIAADDAGGAGEFIINAVRGGVGSLGTIGGGRTYEVLANTSGALAIFTLPPGSTSDIRPRVDRPWFHLLAAWDAGNNLGGLWIDDQQVSIMARNRNAAIPYSLAGNFSIGADASAAATAPAGQMWNGALADIYFAPGQYMDMTVAANRRKLSALNGEGFPMPIDLGATGTNPTGVAPAIYMHMDHGADPATFITNKGNGGAFTRVGGAPIAGQAIPLCLYPGHSADEHAAESIVARADKSSIVVGTGFNIRVRNRSQLNEPLTAGAAGALYPLIGGRGTRLCGKYNIGWAWN